MTIAFRTQVGLMERLPCSIPACITTASYTYESADDERIHLCVGHDREARSNASLQGDVIADMTFNQEAL